MSDRKQYRNDNRIYETVSLKLEREIIEKIYLVIGSKGNMSHYIEEKVLHNLPYKKDIPERREYGSYPVKKTLTFSHDFLEKTKEFNRSLLVESILKEIL